MGKEHHAPTSTNASGAVARRSARTTRKVVGRLAGFGRTFGGRAGEEGCQQRSTAQHEHGPHEHTSLTGEVRDRARPRPRLEADREAEERRGNAKLVRGSNPAPDRNEAREPSPCEDDEQLEGGIQDVLAVAEKGHEKSRTPSTATLTGSASRKRPSRLRHRTPSTRAMAFTWAADPGLPDPSVASRRGLAGGYRGRDAHLPPIGHAVVVRDVGLDDAAVFDSTQNVRTLLANPPRNAAAKRRLAQTARHTIAAFPCLDCDDRQARFVSLAVGCRPLGALHPIRVFVGVARAGTVGQLAQAVAETRRWSCIVRLACQTRIQAPSTAPRPTCVRDYHQGPASTTDRRVPPAEVARRRRRRVQPRARARVARRRHAALALYVGRSRFPSASPLEHPVRHDPAGPLPMSPAARRTTDTRVSHVVRAGSRRVPP